MLAAGSRYSLDAKAGKAFNSLQQFQNQHKDWIFGHLGYDLKMEVEDLASKLLDNVQFPDLHFFIPQILLILKNDQLEIGAFSLEQVENTHSQLVNTSLSNHVTLNNISLKSRITKNEYITTIEKLKAHILKGDCYEINFCQEFYSENIAVDPYQTFQKLAALSPNPFAAFYRYNDKYLMCESPERYLKKEGQKIFSQPIKGTAKRNHDDLHQDNKNKQSLLTSIKELSENVMITDLVRNDLSKICTQGSVTVQELQGLYTFPHVHQMISTITGNLATENIADIFKATFPMGSMTGAPKKKVMQLIENYETSKRGLFSGSIGYFTPDNNFDFNVVIRSILYNQDTNYVSVSAGSAITINSDPLEEYDECLIKISAAATALNS